MKRCSRRTAAVATIALLAGTWSPATLAQTSVAKTDIARGKYLVAFGGCGDCHTPKVMTPNGPVPDETRLLSGYPAQNPIPAVPPDALGMGPARWGAMTTNDLTAWVGPWGISFAMNLTPDKNTGLGNWSASDFVKTMRTGKHLGAGRPLLPPMPWYDVAVLTDRDIKAIFAYLRSIKPIDNAVPAPIPPKK
ncbi:MAG TPA: diheme cytochrome c-553 [Caldimonas sp.]|nr:diheme cytochrome c-553 [Caldimonas sp.]